MKIVVLGAGRVGSAITKDLANNAEFTVTVVDASFKALDRLSNADTVSTTQADLSHGDEIAKVVKEADLAVGAVPGLMGFKWWPVPAYGHSRDGSSLSVPSG